MTREQRLIALALVVRRLLRRIRSIAKHPFTLPLIGGTALALFSALAIYWVLPIGLPDAPPPRQEIAASRSTMPQRNPYAAAAEEISFGESAQAQLRLMRLSKGLPINVPYERRERMLILYWRDRLSAKFRDAYAEKCVVLADSIRARTVKWPDISEFAILIGYSSEVGTGEFIEKMAQSFYQIAFAVGESIAIRNQASLKYQESSRMQHMHEWKSGEPLRERDYQERKQSYESARARDMRRQKYDYVKQLDYEWSRTQARLTAAGPQPPAAPDDWQAERQEGLKDSADWAQPP